MFRCAECITDRDDEPIDKPEVSPYKVLTVILGDRIERYEYTGLSDKTIEVKDGSEVSY